MNIWPIIKSVGGAEVTIYETRKRVFTFEVYLDGDFGLMNAKSFWCILENRSKHISVNKLRWRKELKMMVLSS